MSLSLPVFCGRTTAVVVSVLVLAFPPVLAAHLFAQTSLAKISADNLTNSDSLHRTEVEPASFAWGSTIVSAFHVARRPGSIGWGNMGRASPS